MIFISLVKIKINKYLTEGEASDIDEKKFFNYLKFVAIFEQFFRFLDGHQIGLEEIPGINTFVNNEKLDELSEIKLAQKVDSIINRFIMHHNIKSIAERRYTEFTKWFKEKRKDDLEVIIASIDYISKTIKEFNQKIAQLRPVEQIA